MKKNFVRLALVGAFFSSNHLCAMKVDPNNQENQAHSLLQRKESTWEQRSQSHRKTGLNLIALYEGGENKIPTQRPDKMLLFDLAKIHVELEDLYKNVPFHINEEKKREHTDKIKEKLNKLRYYKYSEFKESKELTSFINKLKELADKNQDVSRINLVVGCGTANKRDCKISHVESITVDINHTMEPHITEDICGLHFPGIIEKIGIRGLIGKAHLEYLTPVVLLDIRLWENLAQSLAVGAIVTFNDYLFTGNVWKDKEKFLVNIIKDGRCTGLFHDFRVYSEQEDIKGKKVERDQYESLLRRIPYWNDFLRPLGFYLMEGEGKKFLDSKEKNQFSRAKNPKQSVSPYLWTLRYFPSRVIPKEYIGENK